VDDQENITQFDGLLAARIGLGFDPDDTGHRQCSTVYDAITFELGLRVHRIECNELWA
jgi:hypothetical protein